MVVTLPPALHRRLKKLAAANHRTDAALAEELIVAFVEQREWIAAVEVGLKEADEGKLVDFDDVKRAWRKN